MLSYGITDIQNKPSLIKNMTIGKFIDKRAHKTLGYFISSKYEQYIEELLEKIEKEERKVKLQKIKNATDLDFLEHGIDDGL